MLPIAEGVAEGSQDLSAVANQELTGKVNSTELAREAAQKKAYEDPIMRAAWSLFCCNAGIPKYIDTSANDVSTHTQGSDSSWHRNAVVRMDTDDSYRNGQKNYSFRASESDMRKCCGKWPSAAATIPRTIVSAAKAFMMSAARTYKNTLHIYKIAPSCWVAPLLLLVLILGMGIWGVEQGAAKEEEHLKDVASSAAMGVAKSFEIQLQQTYAPCITLALMVQQYPKWQDLRPQFLRMAPPLLDLVPSDALLEIQFAPQGVITDSYPSDPAATGRDLFVEPTRRAVALETVSLGVLTVAGPVVLFKGGLGINARVPVFLDNQTAEETYGMNKTVSDCPACYDPETRRRFWGFSIAVISWQNLTGPGSQLYQLKGLEYRYVLQQKDPDDPDKLKVIASSQDLPRSNLETVSTTIYTRPRNIQRATNSSSFTDFWYLRVQPTHGWTPRWKPAALAGVILGAFVVAFLVSAVMVNRMHHITAVQHLQVSNTCLAHTTQNLKEEKERLDALLERQFNLIAMFEKDTSRAVEAAQRRSGESVTLERIEAVRRSMAVGGTSFAAGPSVTLQLQVLELLGEGTFGKVYKGLWRGTKVAIKTLILPANMSGAEKREKMAIMEAAISSSLSHPNIVQTYTYSVKPLHDSTHRQEEDDNNNLLQEKLIITTSTSTVFHTVKRDGPLFSMGPPLIKTAPVAAANGTTTPPSGGNGTPQGRHSSETTSGNTPTPPTTQETNHLAAALLDSATSASPAQQKPSCKTVVTTTTTTTTTTATVSSRPASMEDNAGNASPTPSKGSACDKHEELLRYLMEKRGSQGQVLSCAACGAAAASGVTGDSPTAGCKRRGSQDAAGTAGAGAAVAGGAAASTHGHTPGNTGTGSLSGANNNNNNNTDAMRKKSTSVHSYEVRLVLEYCDCGTLREALEQGAFFSRSGLNYPAILDTALDIAQAMLHLHSLDVLHGDLKARNILLKSSGDEPRGVVAKVSDFGLSLRLDKNATHVSSVFQGTMTHMAPEVMLHGHMGKPADVYSFGVTLYELFTGSKPYAGIPGALLGHMITKEQKRPTFPAITPPDYKALAEKCWLAEPSKRPTFEDIALELMRMRESRGPTKTPLVIHVQPKPLLMEDALQAAAAVAAPHPSAPVVGQQRPTLPVLPAGGAHATVVPHEIGGQPVIITSSLASTRCGRQMHVLDPLPEYPASGQTENGSSPLPSPRVSILPAALQRQSAGYESRLSPLGPSSQPASQGTRSGGSTPPANISPPLPRVSGQHAVLTGVAGSWHSSHSNTPNPSSQALSQSQTSVATSADSNRLSTRRLHSGPLTPPTRSGHITPCRKGGLSNEVAVVGSAATNVLGYAGAQLGRHDAPALIIGDADDQAYEAAEHGGGNAVTMPMGLQMMNRLPSTVVASATGESYKTNVTVLANGMVRATTVLPSIEEGSGGRMSLDAATNQSFSNHGDARSNNTDSKHQSLGSPFTTLDMADNAQLLDGNASPRVASIPAAAAAASLVTSCGASNGYAKTSRLSCSTPGAVSGSNVV